LRFLQDHPRLSGVYPEEIGVKLQDLPCQGGPGFFKGVLVIDPDKPWPCYELIRDVQVQKSSTQLAADKVAFQSQADEVVKHVVTSKEADKRVTWLQKLRTVTLSVEVVREKLSAKLELEDEAAIMGSTPERTPDKRKATHRDDPSVADSADECNDDEDDEMGENDEQEEEEEEEHGEEEEPAAKEGVVGFGRSLSGGAPSVASTSARTSRLGRKTSVSLYSAKKSAGSGGAEGGRKAGPGKGVEETADELVDRRIASCGLEQILAGVALGTQLRWCWETRDRLPHDSVGALAKQRLDAHIDAAESASWLATNKLDTVPEQTLQKHVTLLEHVGAEFPSNMKNALVQRRLASLRAEKDTEQLLRVAAPWACTSTEQEGDAAARFRPTDPGVSGCDGSRADKLNMFKASVVCYFSEFIKEGEAHAKEFLKQVVSLQKFLLTNPPPRR